MEGARIWQGHGVGPFLLLQEQPPSSTCLGSPTAAPSPPDCRLTPTISTS